MFYLLCWLLLFFSYETCWPKGHGFNWQGTSYILYSQFILKQVCWSETSLPLTSKEDYLLLYDLPVTLDQSPFALRKKGATL